MGGDAAGPIEIVDHEMRFWEAQGNALRMTLVGRILTLDELRRCTEDLGEDYHRLDYFERAAESLHRLLVEKGILTEAEIGARMDEIRNRAAAGA